MATVPTYQRQVAQRALPNVRVSPQVVDTSAIQQGLDAAGNVAIDMAVKQREEADTTAVVGADTGLSKWTNDTLFNQQGGVYSKKGKNALDVTNTTLAAYDQQVQSTLQSLSNDVQRKRFQAIAAQRRESLNGKLNQYEYGQIQQYQNDTDEAALGTAVDTATLNFSDPNEIGRQRQKAMAIVQSQAERNGWSPEQLQQAQTQISSRILSGAITRMAESNPSQAKQYYESAKDGLDARAQIGLSSTIEQAFRRQEAEVRQRQIASRQLQAIARVELQSRVQDAQAAYLQGYEFDNPPNKADFEAAMGSEKGAQAYESFSKVQAVAPAIREFATADPQERAKILERFQPTQDGVAGEGFDEDSKLYRHVVTVASGMMKQQQEDPSGYAAKYSAPVREAFAAAQQAGTPEAYKAYADATVAEQRRLGVQSPKLLPDAAADQIAAGFNSQVAGGENAATLIEQQQEQWGSNFPLIAQQLGKKLPPEAQVIATGLPKDVAERMASVAALTTDDLKKGLDKGVATNVASAVQSAMNPFAQSLQGQAGGVETFNTMYDAANKAALSYVRQGMTPEKAAQRVVNGMVNDKYDFFDTYRVPKTLDTAAVKRGADRALANISTDDLMMLPGIRGVPDDMNLEQLREAVIDGGQWVPNNDESGLSLTLNGYRLLGKDGKPITRTWDELTTDGLKQQESNASRIGRVRGLGVIN